MKTNKTNNRTNLMGLAFIALAAVSVALLMTSVGDLAAQCVGKAVWYLPYVAVVGAIRCLRAA